jgi:lysozyme
METLEERIKRHEGFIDHVYLDSKGRLTCGYGHYLYLDSPVSREIAELFFFDDLRNAYEDFDKLRFIMGDEVILSLNKLRKEVIIEMLFNMNLPKVLKFKKMWACIKDKDWKGARREMLDSKWHKDVGIRAEELATDMEFG